MLFISFFYAGFFQTEINLTSKAEAIKDKGQENKQDSHNSLQKSPKLIETVQKMIFYVKNRQALVG